MHGIGRDFNHTRYQDYRQVRPVLLDELCQLRTRPSRHYLIGESHIHRMAGKNSHRFQRRSGGYNLIPLLFEDKLSQPKRKLLIVNAEDEWFMHVQVKLSLPRRQLHDG